MSVAAGSSSITVAAAFLAFVLVLNFAEDARAQNPFDGLEEAEKAAKVWLIIEREVLEVSPSVARLRFAYDRLPRKYSTKEILEGAFASAELVEAVQTWGEDPSATLKMDDLELIQSRSELEEAERRKYFDMKAKTLRALWAKYKPVYMQRMTTPPYDTLLVRPSGRVIRRRDMSILYFIVLPEATRRSHFIEEANRISGVTAEVPIRAEFG